MNYRLAHFKAWCSGTAYPIPNRALCHDRIRGIQISIDEVVLGNFYFKTDKEYGQAKRILRIKA